MALLVEGGVHPLSTDTNKHNNKSVVYVKLTDSALKSLEDIARHKVRLEIYIFYIAHIYIFVINEDISPKKCLYYIHMPPVAYIYVKKLCVRNLKMF